MRIAALVAALIGFSAPAAALEWRLGLAYASGVGDVTDLYEDNLDRSGFQADVDLKFPIGVAFGAKYEWGASMRADVGLGPAFFIEGDVDHFELPLTTTVGYNFNRAAQMSPYVRGGLAYHVASGDFYESSSIGPFLAAGVDFNRFAVEVSGDFSEVEFETITCNSVGRACVPGAEELSTYDIVVSLFWRFY